MARHLKDVTVTCLLLLLSGTMSCQTTSRTLPLSTGWEATPFKRASTAAQLAAHLPTLNLPAAFTFCRGLQMIKAEDPIGTEAINIAIPNPRGPYGGVCGEHRNIDSDPRVWKNIFDQVITKIEVQQSNLSKPAT